MRRYEFIYKMTATLGVLALIGLCVWLDKREVIGLVAPVLTALFVSVPNARAEGADGGGDADAEPSAQGGGDGD